MEGQVGLPDYSLEAEDRVTQVKVENASKLELYSYTTVR